MRKSTIKIIKYLTLEGLLKQAAIKEDYDKYSLLDTKIKGRKISGQD